MHMYTDEKVCFHFVVTIMDDMLYDFSTGIITAGTSTLSLKQQTIAPNIHKDCYILTILILKLHA